MNCAMLWRRLALSGSILPSARRAVAGCFSRSHVTFTDDVGPYPIFYDLLLKNRIVFINGPISDDTASLAVAQLIFLESKNYRLPIRLYINSPGGVVTAGLTIYDTMQYILSPISTLCLGQAASIASLLLAAGTPGKRYVFPHSRIMIHQPSGEAFSKATGIAIPAEEILKRRESLSEIYGHHTGQPIQRIEQCMDRDMFMSSDEAKEFGLVDEVIAHRPSALKEHK